MQCFLRLNLCVVIELLAPKLLLSRVPQMLRILGRHRTPLEIGRLGHHDNRSFKYAFGALSLQTVVQRDVSRLLSSLIDVSVWFTAWFSIVLSFTRMQHVIASAEGCRSFPLKVIRIID